MNPVQHGRLVHCLLSWKGALLTCLRFVWICKTHVARKHAHMQTASGLPNAFGARRPRDDDAAPPDATDANVPSHFRAFPVDEHHRVRRENPLNGCPLSDQYFRLQAHRKELPMWAQSDAIVATVATNQVTLLIGETGSGKSTQLPQFLLAGGAEKRIMCTQPRRVAAMSVAQRVADELDVRCGEEVGYVVRFEDRRSERTRVVFATDGMLLREAQTDPRLSQYEIIIIDEAHERTVNTDLLLGFLKGLVLERRDLRLVVMSATLDEEKFSRYFIGAPLIRVPGRLYEVREFFLATAARNYVDAAVQYAWDTHVKEAPGDVLVFLTGQGDIERACALTRANVDRADDERHRQCLILPLYGALPMDDQRKVFTPTPPGWRKIVFATNIAETSLTIDGIVYVIDSGFCKQHTYNPDTRMQCLAQSVISKAAANQRKGRAGRTRPGMCMRLYREVDYRDMQEQTYPEMQRCNLVDVVLTMMRLGIANVVQFPYIDAPAMDSMSDALASLMGLEAVEVGDNIELTDLGKQMADYPVDCMTARMLIFSARYGCSHEVAIIAAMLSTTPVFTRPHRRADDASERHRRFAHSLGDHLTLLYTFMAFQRNHRSPEWCYEHYLSHRGLQQAESIYGQLTRHMEQRELPLLRSSPPSDEAVVNTTAIRKAIAAGFFQKVAFRPSNSDRYVQVKQRTVCRIHKSSILGGLTPSLQPRWVAFNDLEMTSVEEGAYMRTVTPIEPTWLALIAPEEFNPDDIEDREAANVMRNAHAKAGELTAKGEAVQWLLDSPLLEQDYRGVPAGMRGVVAAPPRMVVPQMPGAVPPPAAAAVPVMPGAVADAEAPPVDPTPVPGPEVPLRF